MCKDHEAFINHPRTVEISQRVYDELQRLLVLDPADRQSHIELFVSSTGPADWPAYRGAIHFMFRREAAGDGNEAIAKCRILNDLSRAFTPASDMSEVVKIAATRAEFQALPDDSKMVMGGIGMILMGMASMQALSATDDEVAALLKDLDERIAEFLTNAGERFSRVKH